MDFGTLREQDINILGDGGWGKWVKIVKRYKFPIIREVKSKGYNVQHGDYS